MLTWEQRDSFAKGEAGLWDLNIPVSAYKFIISLDAETRVTLWIR